MHIIFLIQPEKEALKSYSQDCLIKGIRLRSQAVLMRNQGVSVQDISEVLFKTERTITEWLKEFIKNRISSLISKKVDNENAAKLTRDQKEEIKKLVKQYPSKKICIIWDNARWHKSKKLRKELRKGKSLERIHLINLPPYAPETNPIEHVWGSAKNKLANKSGELFEEIKHQFMQLTHNQTFLYQI